MKKLLAILGSLTMTVGGAASVVACGNNKNKNDDTTTDLVKGIDSDGNIIDTSALLNWWFDHKGVALGKEVPLMKEFLQFFAAGIMKEAKTSDLFKDIIPTDQANQYAIENLQQTLQDKWGTEGFDEEKDDTNTDTVWGAARAAFKKEKDDFIKNQGEKNWQSKFVNQLASTFSYVKKDYETLKKAYINNQVLTNKDKSAMAMLTSTLTTNYSQQFSNTPTSKATLVTTFLNNWGKRKVSQLESSINSYISYVTNNHLKKSEAKYLNLVNLINATGGKTDNIANKNNKGTEPDDSSKWDLQKIKWLTLEDDDNISTTLITDLMMRLNGNYNNTSNELVSGQDWMGSHNVGDKWYFTSKDGKQIGNNGDDTFFNLVSTYPNPDYLNLPLDSSSNSSSTSNPLFGWLTNSQKFIVDEYFQSQKPVSISEVVFKKASDAKLEEGITGLNFINPTSGNKQAYMQFYGLYDFLKNYVVELGTAKESTGVTRKGVISPIQGTSQYNFDTIFANAVKKNIGQIRLNGIEENDPYWKDAYETKNSSKLLTLASPDTDYSNITKYSVYDFLQAKDNNDLYDITQIDQSRIPTEMTQAAIAKNLKEQWGFNVNPTAADNIGLSIETAPDGNDENKANKKTIFNALYTTLTLIEKLNRKVTGTGFQNEYSTSDSQSNNKVYQILNSKQGIIAFVDTDGLHITKINGYDVLKAPTATQSSNYYKTNESNYINEAEAFLRLSELVNSDTTGNYRYIYQDYNNQIGLAPSGETDQFTQKLIYQPDLQRIKTYGVAYQDLNQSITNNYEKFLINNSILTGKGKTSDSDLPPFYLFNLLQDATNSVNAESDDKASMNNSWLWDYFKNLLKVNDDQGLLDKFIGFKNEDTLSQETKKWFLNKVLSLTKHTQETSFSTFNNGWDKWNDTIDKTKKGTTEDQDLPLMKLAYGEWVDADKAMNTSHLDKIGEMEKFNPFATSKLMNYSFEIVVGNYTNFALSGNKKAGVN